MTRGALRVSKDWGNRVADLERRRGLEHEGEPRSLAMLVRDGRNGEEAINRQRMLAPDDIAWPDCVSGVLA